MILISFWFCFKTASKERNGCSVVACLLFARDIGLPCCDVMTVDRSSDVIGDE